MMNRFHLDLPVVTRGPFKWDDEGTYYYEFDWSDRKIYGDRELMFMLTAKQDSNYLTHWDPSNDWSRQGVTGDYAISKKIPVYLDGVKIFGEEPPTMNNDLLGDLDISGSVDALDYAIMKQYLLGMIEFDSETYRRADLNEDGEVDAIDLSLIKKLLLVNN